MNFHYIEGKKIPNQLDIYKLPSSRYYAFNSFIECSITLTLRDTQIPVGKLKGPSSKTKLVGVLPRKVKMQAWSSTGRDTEVSQLKSPQDVTDGQRGGPSFKNSTGILKN